MRHILAVRIPIGNKLLFFRSEPYVVAVGNHVLVQVEGELQMGKVERVAPVLIPISDSPPPDAGMPTIFRPATEDDLVRDRENRVLAREAFELCRQYIQERNLEMKLVDVDVLFDGSKMLFFFTAPNRIDFRELVKDLVRAFRTRIELRQIGARHETQMLGGIGNCGQLVCCQRYLRQFAPSTIKMAKEQNLFLNPAKISGVCNRLLCCLSYEQANYEEFLAQCPKIGKKYATALGQAKVIRANYFRRSVNFFLESGGEREVEIEEWFKLVAANRIAPPAKPEPLANPQFAKPFPVEPVHVLGASPGLAPGSSPDPSSRDAAARTNQGKDESPGPDEPQKTGGSLRDQAKKDGRPGSRKSKRRSKRRSRSSRHKP